MKNFLKAFSFFGVFLLVASCGPKEPLSYVGSSTIGMNFLPEAARLFTKKTGIKFTKIKNPGSGKGVKAVLDGKFPMGGASRKLKQSEIDAGIVGTPVGYDAIAVIVNKANPVESLTKDQIKGILTGKIKNWKEVGGKDAPIHPITEILGEKRATVLVFQKILMDNSAFGKGFLEIDYPKDQNPAVAKDPNAIGQLSLAFVDARVKALGVNGVKPSKENVANGSYIVSRPLILHTKGPHKGSAKAFIEFMLTPEGQKLVSKKFVPAR